MTNWRSSLLPEDFLHTSCLVGPTGQDEQRIAQTIQVRHDKFSDLLVASQPHAEAFGAAADRPGLV